MSNPIKIIIFCAFSNRKKNGVQRFAEQLIGENASKEGRIPIYWNKEKGYLKSLICLFKDFFLHIRSVDMIHFVVLTPFNVPFLIISKILKKKIITTYHGDPYEESPLLKRPIIWFIFWVSDRLTRYLTDILVSPTEYLLKKLNINSGREYVIPNPYDLSQIIWNGRKRDKTFSMEIVLSTASNFNILRKVDGLVFLLEAMKNLNNLKNVRLLVFGGGHYLEQFKENYIAMENVVFMGYCENFKEYLNETDVYIHISLLDNQPYAIIEAMLYGKVIICNDLKPFFETLDPKNNYIVPLDSHSITNSIIQVVNEIKNNSNTFDDKGYRNKMYAEAKYSSKNVIKRYENLYKQLFMEKFKTSSNFASTTRHLL